MEGFAFFKWFRRAAQNPHKEETEFNSLQPVIVQDNCYDGIIPVGEVSFSH